MMSKISTILIPFNFSNTSEKALEYAVEFVGKDPNLQIILAYVLEGNNAGKDEEVLKAVETKYGASLKRPMEWVSATGSLTESLLRITEKQHIDLIIMGTFGAFDDEDSKPTNTSNLVREVNRPVLVVPYSVEEFKMKNIALVLGKEEIEDTKALDTLLRVARRFNAQVHVLTIQNKPGVYGYSEIDEKNENAIQYYLENFYADRMFIENPDVVEGILNYAVDKNIDAITILPRNHSKNSTPSKGLLTHELTLHSKVPILAIN